MILMISNCGGDERGKITGGQAGDQTGKEWNIVPWYSRPWYCVLRHPDPGVRDLLAQYARAAAENNNIGYDQWERLTFFNRLKEANWNPSNITEKCETDCSAGVVAITIAVGNVLKIPELAALNPKLYTGNMRNAFKSAGFECLTEKKYKSSDKYLIPGDILLNDTHHTAINLDFGSEVNDKDSDEPVVPVKKKSIEEIAKEVIRGDWGNGMDRINRLTAAGYNASEIQNEVNRMLGIGQTPISSKTTFKVINIKTYLNVRSGPGTSYSIVGSMKNGDTFTVDSVTTQNNFTKVADGKWVSSNYISRV